MIEEAEYAVTLTIHLTTLVMFSPMERDSPITKEDAIDNAIGLLPYLWNDEFSSTNIEGKAIKTY